MPNPALRRGLTAAQPLPAGSSVMTLNGTLLRTGALLALMIGAGAWAWGEPPWSIDVVLLGIFGGLITASVMSFWPKTAPWLAPAYAVCQGMFLGLFSAAAEREYPGIALQTVGTTVGVLFVTLVLYRTHIIRVTDRFRMGVMAAVGGIMIYYTVSLVLAWGFGLGESLINNTSWLGILFSLFACGAASLSLILDFDLIQQNSTGGAPRYMEWYTAFGLLATLIWLYIEILRLIAILRD